jgi:hypothetical protein
MFAHSAADLRQSRWKHSAGDISEPLTRLNVRWVEAIGKREARQRRFVNHPIIRFRVDFGPDSVIDHWPHRLHMSYIAERPLHLL